MIPLARVARWTAIAIAAAAILDPAVPLPRRTRPAVRVIGAHGDAVTSVTRHLRDAGFATNEPDGEVATILVGDHIADVRDAAPLPAPGTSHLAPGMAPVAPGTSHAALRTSMAAGTPQLARRTSMAPETSHLPLWALDTSPRSPNVAILHAVAPPVRLPEQAVDVRVTVEGRGLPGQTSELVLEDGVIVVASARHTWKGGGERWQAALSYRPPAAAGGRLRARVVETPGETTVADNSADLAVPPLRGAIRALVIEAGVTWPALFVRRSLEQEPAFAVTALQRASTRIATRAGAPPAALTREALTPFEVALVGAPDNLTRSDAAALRWFVEERGGVAVLVPDRRPTGPYTEMFDAPVLEPRTLERPVALGEGLQAMELLITRRTPPGSRTLAAMPSGETVVFSARRGAGAVIFSGALDAWRYRAQAQDGFARFWRRVIAEEAMSVPPVLEVSVEPALVATGALTRIRARLRATELAAGRATPNPDSLDLDTVTARAVSPGARVDLPVRLWPTAEPGVFDGQFRPSVAGDFNVTVSAGARRGDASLTVAAAASPASTADPEGLALAARVSGGRVFPADRPSDLVDALKQAFPARVSLGRTRPMRSPWWVVPFAGLLCAEWALRRRSGLP